MHLARDKEWVLLNDEWFGPDESQCFDGSDDWQVEGLRNGLEQRCETPEDEMNIRYDMFKRMIRGSSWGMGA